MSIEAKVVADSISPTGVRLTTMVLRYPRFIHSEFLTHRTFSRNASSSRAIPVKKILDQVKDDPALPIHWGKNQPGMQAREELVSEDLEAAKTYWLEARDEAVRYATWMTDRGLHKQVANRILEPFQHITVVVTATEWDNFYHLRCHPDAQPEMKALAEAMLKAHNESFPTFVGYGDYHLPFISANELWDIEMASPDGLEIAKKCSVARCARVSYLNHDGTNPSIEKDIQLHDRLLESQHLSPFEHVATPFTDLNYHANFKGWYQYRLDVAQSLGPYPGLFKYLGDK